MKHLRKFTRCYTGNLVLLHVNCIGFGFVIHYISNLVKLVLIYFLHGE